MTLPLQDIVIVEIDSYMAAPQCRRNTCRSRRNGDQN